MKQLYAFAILSILINSYDAKSYCNGELGQLRIKDNGQLDTARSGETISKIEKKNGKEYVTFTQKPNPLDSNPREKSETIEIEKDNQGRVISAARVVDYQKLTPEEKKNYKEEEAYKLAYSASPDKCKWEERLGLNGAVSYQMNTPNCPSILVYNPTLQKYIPADYKIINQANFGQYKFKGIKTWEEFEKNRIKDQERWDKNSSLISAYSTVLDKAGWAIPIGDKHYFEYANGSCLKSKESKITLNGKNGAVKEEIVFDSRDCEKVLPVYQKYSTELSECSRKTSMANKEFNNALNGVAEAKNYENSSADYSAQSSNSFIEKFEKHGHCYQRKMLIERNKAKPSATGIKQ